MKKYGFTLAEVLVSLAIVGVVAALTIPSLTANTANAKIGPTLAKAAAAFEQANQAMLNDLGVDSLTDAGLIQGDSAETIGSNYANLLQKNLKIISKSAKGDYFYIFTKDNVAYAIPKLEAPTNSQDPIYKQRLTKDLKVDINGDRGPDTAGSDVFYFSLWNDGSLRPKGGSMWDGTGAGGWKSGCQKDETPTDPTTCAGHIFENNLKVLYK